MAELLVLVQETQHPDPAVNRMRFQRGDVIHAMNDGTGEWGRDEVGNPAFRIVKCPGEPVSRFLALAEGEYVYGPEGVIRTRQRAAHLDVSKLADVMTADELLAAVRVKTPINQVRIG